MIRMRLVEHTQIKVANIKALVACLTAKTRRSVTYANKNDGSFIVADLVLSFGQLNHRKLRWARAAAQQIDNLRGKNIA